MQALIPILSSLVPGLLGHLFGGNPQQAYQNQVSTLMGPQNMGRLTNQFFQQAVGSPAYAGAQSSIAAGANQTGNQLQANLGARGIGTSGSGALLSSLLPSLVGSQMGGLRTQAYQGAQGQAQNSVAEQIKALQGTMLNPQGGMMPSQNQSLFAGGLAALGPYLQHLLSGGGQMPSLDYLRGAAGIGGGGGLYQSNAYGQP